MDISDKNRHGALDILASVVSNVQEFTPTKKNFPEHRVSCHRCGNIRKRKLLCPRQTCPHIFCGRCADKMIEEHGDDVFVDGCPVCHELCCCSNKTVMCNRQNHCYRKCPATKGKGGLRGDSTQEPEYQHISAPALEILAQVVSDPLQRGDNQTSSNRAESSPETKPKRKMTQSSPIKINMNTAAAAISLSAAMYDTRPPQKSPRLEGIDRNVMYLLPSPDSAAGLLSSNPPSTTSSPLFNSPFSPGYQGFINHSGLFSKEMTLPPDRGVKPQPPSDSKNFSSTTFSSSDAAAVSATYAISSLSALSAAAGNYDQYTQNIKMRSPEVTPSVPISSEGIPPKSVSTPVSSSPILPTLPPPSPNLSHYDFPRPKQTETTSLSIGSHLMSTKSSSSFLNHPQYMVTAAALSDSSFDSYVTPSVPISTLGRPVQPTLLSTLPSTKIEASHSSLDS